MDFWTSTDPANYSDHFDHKSLLALQAQQLLIEVGWAYYTIWKPATSHDSQIGLAWSRGGVNESLLPRECTTIAHHLQNFYKQCASLIPLGLGLAGETFASCQIRWASGEEMLRQIINSLSSQNWLPPPELVRALEANYFKTIVCIPLENGAGVLEMGMTKLVPKNDADMNDQTLRLMNELEALINGLGTDQGTLAASWEEHLMSSCFEACTETLPNNAGVQFWNPNEHYKTTPIMRSSESREIFRHPSFMRSYNSSFSSTSSSSTFSTSDQMGSNNTTVVLNTSPPPQLSSMNNEDTSLMSPTTPKYNTVNSFDELPIVNQFDCIHVHGVTTPMRVLDHNESYGINDADSTHFPYDYDLWYLSADDVGLHGLQVPTNRGEALLESRYLDLPSEPSMYHYPLFDHVLQPIPCACNTEVISHDQRHHQWRETFPSINEGERVCEQLTPHEHSMFWPGISNTPLVEDSLGDMRLEAKYRDEEIMQEQGGATLVIDDEGKYTTRNKKSNIGLSSTNHAGYQAFNETAYKMCNEKGEEMIVSLARTSTIEAACGYVGYASGPTEGGKGAGLSTSQGLGSYVSYASCSAEAEKASSYGAGDSRRQPQRIRRQDDQSIASRESNLNVAGSALQGLDARQHHNQVERERRSKQGEYIDILRSLLAGNPKRDKVAILQGAIQQIKELKGRIKELEGQRGQDKNSRQKISSPKNDSCNYVNNTMPHEVLTTKIDVEDVEVNATNINIMDALQKKNFSWFEYSSQFFESKNELSIKVLAHYKDEELDKIQHIKEWWEQLTKDYPKP